MGWFDKIASRIASELDESGLDSDARAQLELARAYLDRGDLDEAESRLTPLLQQHPRVAAVHQTAGDLAQARGHWEDAVTHFGRAVDADASNARAWLSLADALYPLQRFEPALEAGRRAAHLFEKFLDPEISKRGLARVHVLKGRVALAQQRFEVARHELDRALSLGVEDQGVVADHGRALSKLDPEGGARWLLHAARNPQANFDLALEAAAAQSDPRVAAELLEGFAKTHSQLSADELHRLQSRTALAWAQAQQAPQAQALMSAFESDKPSYLGEACHDLARAAALLNDFGAACEWATCAQNTTSTLDPQLRRVWALGTCDLQTLNALATDIAAQAPELAAQIVEALSTPPNLSAVATLVHESPTAAARAHWAQRLAPSLPDEDSALSLLQFLENIVTPLPPSPHLAAALARAREALSRPLIVALLGEFNAGKSSLVNALVQSALAPVGIKPTTATLNVFRHGLGGAHVIYRNGKVRRLQTTQVQPFLSTLAQDDAEAIDSVDVFLPHAPLQTFEWVDTPGLNAPNAAHERTTQQFMTSADVAVWVLSAHQAAKATEVTVLKQLQASRIPVFAVLNKIDQLDDQEIPLVHEAAANALGGAVIGIMDASLKGETRARQAAHELSQALLGFCEGRVWPLKQRSALLTLQSLIEGAIAQVTQHEPHNETSPEQAALWNQVADNLVQAPAVGSLNTGLSHVVADVAAVFANSGAGPSQEDALMRAFLRHITAALQMARAQLVGLPPTAVAQFDVAAQAYAAQTRGRLEAAVAANALAVNGHSGMQRALEQALPDVERFLWSPWREQLKALVAAEHNRQQQAERQTQARKALHNARFTQPLHTLRERSQRAWQTLLTSAPFQAQAESALGENNAP